MPDLSWWHSADKQREALAGVAGAILVIPQAITFAYLVGLPPEYGLYCAVFVAFFSSLFGNSPMVGGPNTAISILLSLSIMPYAGRGSPLYTEYILLLSLMVGLVQFCIWLLRGAEVFRYLSPAAISGIKMGVGVLLITSALEGTLGMTALNTQFFYEKFYIAIVSWGDIVNPYSATISGITVFSALMMKRRLPRTYIIVAVLIGSIVGAFIQMTVGPVVSQVELLGRVPFHPFPIMMPNVTAEHLLVMEDVLPNAIAIAVLGLGQSLVIARDLKTQLGSKLNLQKEVLAQAVSNMASPFFSTFAGSGSFNRTSVAIEMGARTPLSGLVAACAVVLIAWGLGPFLTHLPMPAVAGVLVLVGIGMIQVSEIRLFWRNRVDIAVFAITLLAVAFIGLEAGILVAALASVGFFVASVSKVGFEVTREGKTERIRVKGNLFYASMDNLANHLRAHPTSQTRLDLSRVPYCDTTAMAMIEMIKLERDRSGGKLEIVPAR
ncbi:MAG: SulP family inorganic anion transporter [Burkholderiales bacterium]